MPLVWGDNVLAEEYGGCTLGESQGAGHPFGTPLVSTPVLGDVWFGTGMDGITHGDFFDFEGGGMSVPEKARSMSLHHSLQERMEV